MSSGEGAGRRWLGGLRTRYPTRWRREESSRWATSDQRRPLSFINFFFLTNIIAVLAWRSNVIETGPTAVRLHFGRIAKTLRTKRHRGWINSPFLGCRSRGTFRRRPPPNGYYTREPRPRRDDTKIPFGRRAGQPERVIRPYDGVARCSRSTTSLMRPRNGRDWSNYGKRSIDQWTTIANRF